MPGLFGVLKHFLVAVLMVVVFTVVLTGAPVAANVNAPENVLP